VLFEKSKRGTGLRLKVEKLTGLRLSARGAVRQDIYYRPAGRVKAKPNIRIGIRKTNLSIKVPKGNNGLQMSFTDNSVTRTGI
jgi:hypothetical protein